ncbi:MAG: hypothetical protein J0L53_15695 [Spirochaetes bacterium]|nr:hypothetical protein [Spirochaetota bacterium]
MKSHLVFFLILAGANLYADRFCFENETPKAKSVVTFNSDYNRISDGLFKVTAIAGGAVKNARFHGTKSGTVYAITFKGKSPYKKPQSDDTIIWTRNGNNLEIPMAGKNAKTGKYADYTAKFVPCKRH